MRGAASLRSGAIFGLGLLVSGMTDTAKVQGFLRLLGPGAWDPTLAFVMAGAILPMVGAWWLTGQRAGPVTGGNWPVRVTGIDMPLATGAVMFGMGWGLVGLCPGPALASLGFGGWPVLVFTCAMIAGMIALPHLIRLTRLTAKA